MSKHSPSVPALVLALAVAWAGCAPAFTPEPSPGASPGSTDENGVATEAVAEPIAAQVADVDQTLSLGDDTSDEEAVTETGDAAAEPITPEEAQPAAPVLAEHDYARAERLLSWNVEDLVYGADVSPNWLADDRFWYRNRFRLGHEFVLVDPAAGEKRRAFDHERLAAALSVPLEEEVDPLALPFDSFELEDDDGAVTFEAHEQRWRCDVVVYECAEAESATEAPQHSVLSPDGRLAVFIREHDLWVKELETGSERRLTRDGRPRYGYATDNEGWRRSPGPVVYWSPDSRWVATFRLDERGVGETYLLETTEPRPRLHTWPYTVPGDSVVPMLERVLIDVEEGQLVRLDTPPDHQRTSSCCGLMRNGKLADVEWNPDAESLAFVSTSRDYRDVALRLVDPTTGEVRTVLEEHAEPFFESSAAGRGVPNWRVLHDRGEVLWYSWRTGWGHLYRYDLETAELTNAVTSGDWNVVNVEYVDPDEGWVYFTAVGRERGRDPYWRHLYRVRLDGSEFTLLTPEPGDHEVAFSPSGEFFVDTHGTPEQPPVSLLRRADGEVVRGLEKVDISDLIESGWQAPQPFTVKARDGETDLHGLMFLPSDFDPERRYPVVNYIYPGPQAGSVGNRTFSAGSRGQARALAELGFVVVQIDALGTPLRSREFHAYYYGDIGDNGLEDQVAGMRELADRHDWIDIERAGIYGHSGGGFASVGALLRYPEFFKVAVASAGNHDNRGYTYYWGEKWQGLLERPDDDGPDSYEGQANHLLAENLRGRLLLSYGTMDANVHPNTTLLLINELIRHNKDFDLMVMPNRGHGYANEPYKIRRTWDYFVEHLMGAQPPREYRIRPAGERTAS